MPTVCCSLFLVAHSIVKLHGGSQTDAGDGRQFSVCLELPVYSLTSDDQDSIQLRAGPSPGSQALSEEQKQEQEHGSQVILARV